MRLEEAAQRAASRWQARPVPPPGAPFLRAPRAAHDTSSTLNYDFFKPPADTLNRGVPPPDQSSGDYVSLFGTTISVFLVVFPESP